MNSSLRAFKNEQEMKGNEPDQDRYLTDLSATTAFLQ